MKTLLHILILIPCLLLTGCDQELLNGLDQRQANEVLAVLQQANISAKKQDEGKQKYKIQVDPADFSRSVQLLKANDLPSKERVEISQMFPADSLATSPRAEKARLISGIEQRLEQSLLVLPNIVKARLHLSYDVETGSTGQPVSPSHLSVLIVYRNNEDETVLINQIKRFLKNSLPAVNYDDISVVMAKASQEQTLIPQVVEAHIYNEAFFYPSLGVVFVVIAGICGFLLRRNFVVSNPALNDKS